MEVKGKFVIGFDTICDGHQTGSDENGNPPLFDSYDEAFKELFVDASCGIEGCEDYLDDEVAREKMINEMNAIIKEDDIEKMKAYMSENPDANYYEEFVQPADEFILGRKTFFTGQGIVIEGTKLEDL
jgi:hypothetical protein